MLAHSKVDSYSTTAPPVVSLRTVGREVLYYPCKERCLRYETTLTERSWLMVAQGVHGLGTNENEKSMKSFSGEKKHLNGPF